jgi:hypothetical protein
MPKRPSKLDLNLTPSQEDDMKALAESAWQYALIARAVENAGPDCSRYMDALDEAREEFDSALAGRNGWIKRLLRKITK